MTGIDPVKEGSKSWKTGVDRHTNFVNGKVISMPSARVAIAA